MHTRGGPNRSYGNTGTPITMDMGGFNIFYREPILGGNRRSFHKTATMLGAVGEFNSLERTSLTPEGLPFATPLTIERLDVFGNITHKWNMDGRYDVPRLVGGEFLERADWRRKRRASKRRSTRRP